MNFGGEYDALSYSIGVISVSKNSLSLGICGTCQSVLSLVLCRQREWVSCTWEADTHSAAPTPEAHAKNSLCGMQPV